jgi:hypothetical protein
MHREVCLKHRKNRREISCGCEREFAAVFVLFVVTAARVRTVRNPRRSSFSPTHQPPLFPSSASAVIVQEPRFLNAIQGMPVQCVARQRKSYRVAERSLHGRRSVNSG